MRKPDRDRAPLGAHCLQARSQERTERANHRGSSSGSRPPPASPQNAGTNGYADIGALRMAATTCATAFRRRRLPNPKEPRHRRPPARRPRSPCHPRYARNLRELNSPEIPSAKLSLRVIEKACGIWQFAHRPRYKKMISNDPSLFSRERIRGVHFRVGFLRTSDDSNDVSSRISGEP
jgi:hypothetical protein